jgi:hypothetical protein
MYVYLILSNIGNKPLFQWRQYASKLLKADAAAQPKGCSARFVPTFASTFAMKMHSMV